MGDLARLSNWFVGASVWGGLPTEGSAAVVSEVAVFKDGEELGCFVLLDLGLLVLLAGGG